MDEDVSAEYRRLLHEIDASDTGYRSPGAEHHEPLRWLEARARQMLADPVAPLDALVPMHVSPSDEGLICPHVLDGLLDNPMLAFFIAADPVGDMAILRILARADFYRFTFLISCLLDVEDTEPVARARLEALWAACESLAKQCSPERHQRWMAQARGEDGPASLSAAFATLLGHFGRYPAWAPPLVQCWETVRQRVGKTAAEISDPEMVRPFLGLRLFKLLGGEDRSAEAPLVP